MGLKEIVLLIAGFAVILYVAAALKEWLNPEKKEENKTDEEYAQESIDELIVKEKKETAKKDDSKKE